MLEKSYVYCNQNKRNKTMEILKLKVPNLNSYVLNKIQKKNIPHCEDYFFIFSVYFTRTEL